jgi:hypothetical protein
MVERFTGVLRPEAGDRSKFDIQLGSAQNDEDRLAMALQLAAIELKTERYQWEQTGNIFIEYESRGRPSGIAATTSDFWCHELARGDETLCYLLIPMDRLKRVCREKFKTLAHKSDAGDAKAQRGIVLRLNDLLVDLGK